jgi:hypothetical protein
MESGGRKKKEIDAGELRWRKMPARDLNRITISVQGCFWKDAFIGLFH